MNYKDHYDKSIPENMHMLLRFHLLNKFEMYFGIIKITQNGSERYLGTSDKEVLIKTIQHYSIMDNVIIKWFYTKDIQVPDEDGVLN